MRSWLWGTKSSADGDRSETGDTASTGTDSGSFFRTGLQGEAVQPRQSVVIQNPGRGNIQPQQPPQHQPPQHHHHHAGGTPQGGHTRGAGGTPGREWLHQGGGGVFSALMHGGRSAAALDAEMERRVSVAARNLGDGVQKIVLAAKMSGNGGAMGMAQPNQESAIPPDEWKIRLLQLLGGTDQEVQEREAENDRGHRSSGAAGSSIEEKLDIDILLDDSGCTNFVLRCVEHELPPNLVHCLRLLRVLELQNAHASIPQDYYEGQDLPEVRPLSTHATDKVCRLLCLLTTESSVGEQLRPHLFGLLALSGASYPPSAIHVVKAASQVIISFSKSCLSSSLVWFLHDRKMIIHMTDDVKELCGMTEVSSPSSLELCLYGQFAEEVDLWIVALKTVVSLVIHSCNYQCFELLRDFDAAGGYHVLCFAIANSRPPRVTKLLELVTSLVCCKTEASVEAQQQSQVDESDMLSEDGSSAPIPTIIDAPDEDRHATNPDAFEIVEDLMVRFVPLLEAYVEANEGDRPELSSSAGVQALAVFSVKTACIVRHVTETGDDVPPAHGVSFDMASELLVSTLQLYSDHSQNYFVIESRYEILAQYLLSFPTFSEISIKVLILKTLEYVCTGLSGNHTSSAVKPLRVASEIFFALCRELLHFGDETEMGINNHPQEEDNDEDEMDDEDDEEPEDYEEGGEEVVNKTGRKKRGKHIGAGSIIDRPPRPSDVTTTPGLRIAFLRDVQMLCDTLEKLLQFDETVTHVMVEGGLLGGMLHDVLRLILTTTYVVGENGAAATATAIKTSPPPTPPPPPSPSPPRNKKAAVGRTTEPPPPEATDADGAFSAICRILKLVVGNKGMTDAFASSITCEDELEKGMLRDDKLNLLLTTGLKRLGDASADAALSVFEAKMSSGNEPQIEADMICLLETLDYFTEMASAAAAAAALSSMMTTQASSSRIAPVGSPRSRRTKQSMDTRAVLRQSRILDTLRSVLETSELAQDVFRQTSGFECIVRLVACLEGVAASPADAPAKQGTLTSLRTERQLTRRGEDLEGDSTTSVGASAVMKVTEACFGVLSAGASPVSRSSRYSVVNSHAESNTSSREMDMLTEDDPSCTIASGSNAFLPLTPAATNRTYLRQRGIYVEFATAISATGILSSSRAARTVVNKALELVEPSLKLPATADDSASYRNVTESGDPAIAEQSILKGSMFLDNADATRLVLGLAVKMTETAESGVAMAQRSLDEIVRLCAPDMCGTALSQLAAVGLCQSLTNPREFASILEDPSHPLFSRFVLLLRRVASFSMTFMDFVALLRCVAGPMLLPDTGADGSGGERRIRLPVISSSVRTVTTTLYSAADAPKPELWQSRETDFCSRLETLSVIAERGDRIARCEVGGDTLNTIALYMQKTPLEERLYKIAEEGRTKFLEVESIDAGAQAAASGGGGQGSGSSNATAAEKLWSPLSSTGFSYSIWLRIPRPVGERPVGSVFVLDMSCPRSEASSTLNPEFFCVWYDLQGQRFNVLSSSSPRNEATCFPVSPLVSGVWHHILLSFQPAKRAMLSRKSVLSLCVDGRPLEADVKFDTVNLPPTSRVHIGVPNPTLASSGIVRGPLPLWELGPTVLLSTPLSNRDATSVFAAGPDFPGIFWGDRPQRLSLAATATAAFAMLAESGEKGSVAGALRRRGVPEVEAVMRERGFGGGPMAGPESDLLSAVGLLCVISPDSVVFCFRASSSSNSMRDGSASSNKRHFSRRLINLARINHSNDNVSTDAVVYGNGSVVSPHCFSDNVQWIGGPNVLLPIVNAARSAASMALALRLIRESVHRHPPNLEMLQAGGGYRMLGLLLRQKHVTDATVLDQCFAFAVHGFSPGTLDENKAPNRKRMESDNLLPKWKFSEKWVFVDLDAMKYLLLNHQVWDLRGSGPDLPLRLLSFLNGLVSANSAHAAFNSRRLHLLGIIRWTLHLMLEAAELYTAGGAAADGAIFESSADAAEATDALEEAAPNPRKSGGAPPNSVSSAAAAAALASGWFVKPPSVSRTAVGGDPGNPLLQGCKTLLRRVLTYMLTPGDLEAIAGAAIYTVSIASTSKDAAATDGAGSKQTVPQQPPHEEDIDPEDEKLPPGPVARVYLIRLLEELVVDGVNEIVTASTEKKSDAEGTPSESAVKPHSGGGMSTNQSYLAMSMSARRRTNRPGQTSASAGGGPNDVSQHPKHQQAQTFLSAFAGILTPVWFACILEGCREEASASAVLRLMILMLQSSPTFASAFEDAGGFAPLVLSIPKFSTCASITMSMLSQLLHAPILHLPCPGHLDPTQLCEVFDEHSDASELFSNDGGAGGGLQSPSDPSCGIFALLAECLGRNIQLASFPNELGVKARQTNEAVLHLLAHRHSFSSSFQEFCRTPDFLEPLAQALCLVHDEKLQRMQRMKEESPEEFERQMMLVESSAPSEAVGQNHDSLDDDSFMSWPSQGDAPDAEATSERKGRHNLGSFRSSETPTERFVGRAEDEGQGGGIGMVQLLHLVLSHAVLTGPLAAPLVSALFRSFPIHASPDEVEAFHLVLIEHCRSVVEDALQRGEPIALANCIGVSSVLLDRLMAGFFTSEPVMEAVHIVLSTLSCLTSPGTYASRTLGSTDQKFLVADTAHIARLTCLTALQRSRPLAPYDEGDDELKLAVLDSIGRNLKQLLVVPSMTVPAQGNKRSGNSAGMLAPPPRGTRLFALWQSASLTRCSPPSAACAYPDLAAVEEPDRAFVVALMAEIHVMLTDKRKDIKEQAVVIVVALLQQRRGIMSDLLITDISRGDNRVETVDLMNRGGFGALLVAHEAATIAENIGGSVPRRRSMNNRSSQSAGTPSKLKYGSFFEWLDRNQAQVTAVFHGIYMEASRLLPGIDIAAATPEEAIENEQKMMLLKLTSQDSSDRTILGGLERAELAQRSHDRTAESHSLWKRQGFDDLSSGAMQWKFLLRQLKGSCSIWEGGAVACEEGQDVSTLSLKRLRKKTSVDVPEYRQGRDDYDIGASSHAGMPAELVRRWKLDMTEGYERQRRRLLPNYEFHSLYNLDETVDVVANSAATSDEKSTDEVSESENSDAALESGTEKRSSLLLEKGSGVEKEGDPRRRRGQVFVRAEESMEATAALLKEMQLGTRGDRGSLDPFDDDDDIEAMEEEGDMDVSTRSNLEDKTSATPAPAGDASLSGTKEPELRTKKVGAEDDGRGDGDDDDDDDDDGPDEAARRDHLLASSYDLITGLLKAGDWPEKSYNVKRCTGLEVRQALLMWCRNAIYIIDGFEQTDGEGLEGRIKRLEKSTSTFYINLRPQGFTSEDGDGTAPEGQAGQMAQSNSERKASDEDKTSKSKEKSAPSSEEVTYQHHSQRIAFGDLHAVYKRRYQLQQIALEFYDIHKKGTLIAFSNNEEREEVLSKVLASPLPNSIFSSSILGGGASINYRKFMNSLKSKITSQWVQGRMTNFDFIMHLNTFAGRSYNDLTQYPVFPWVLANYETEELDLNDPASYRDLSKPMGAQGENRAMQFRERYEALESNYMNEDEPPPFHYGTHYSCAAYVLYYLMRLEPFSRLALSLQGGRFDVADRLFHNIGASWKSASEENLQDVRELIPEFFYLPEFLENKNNFDYGVTQVGKTVHNVTLPPWAKGDPTRFIRINRQALESEFVSRNLHKWADLVFGCKQRGREAVMALNTFVHVTYEGSVDLDTITDPIQRASTIAQIQNFGQTPSRLERKPFPGRNVMTATREKGFDFNALSSLAPLTPPFCIVGAPHRVFLRVTLWDHCKLGIAGQADSSVGDMCLVKGQLVGVGRTCSLIVPAKKYYRFGAPNNGVSIHVAIQSARYREVNRILSIHDGMHRAPISVAKPSADGAWVVTGCMDSTLRVWKLDNNKLSLQATLCGHQGGKVTCIDVCTTFGTIVSGGADGLVIVWDLRTMTFLRVLRPAAANNAEGSKFLSASRSAAVSVSLNHKTGNILSLVGQTLSVYDINGHLLASQLIGEALGPNSRPSCAVATDCPEWMEDGVVAVTGHANGDVRLWSIDYDREALVMRHVVQEKIHSCMITALRVQGDRQETLLVGDKSGKMSVCKTLQIDSMPQEDQSALLRELKTGVTSPDFRFSPRSRAQSSDAGSGWMGLVTGVD